MVGTPTRSQGIARIRAGGGAAAGSAYLSAMAEPLTVIYNQTCPICSREVGAYQRYAAGQDLPIAFADLEDPILAAQGLTPDDAARRLHVLRDGQLLAGTDAFLALWAAMPRFRWLARVLSVPPLRQITAVIYDRIAAPWLYGRHVARMRTRDG